MTRSSELHDRLLVLESEDVRPRLDWSACSSIALLCDLRSGFVVCVLRSKTSTNFEGGIVGCVGRRQCLSRLGDKVGDDCHVRAIASSNSEDEKAVQRSNRQKKKSGEAVSIICNGMAWRIRRRSASCVTPVCGGLRGFRVSRHPLGVCRGSQAEVCVDADHEVATQSLAPNKVLDGLIRSDSGRGRAFAHSSQARSG